MINLILYGKSLPNLEVNFFSLYSNYTFDITTVIKIRLSGESLQDLELTFNLNKQDELKAKLCQNCKKTLNSRRLLNSQVMMCNTSDLLEKWYIR